MIERERVWAAFVDAGLPDKAGPAIRTAERGARPLGGANFTGSPSSALARALSEPWSRLALGRIAAAAP
jgi:hypothetical protein